MSQEKSDAPMSEVFSKWEGRIINGMFPLRRFLAQSDHSVVFLTDCKARNLADAAIKLVPAGDGGTEAQVARWRAVTALSHPNLIRLFQMGSCQLGGQPFLFVVMEYAEENLAEILPHRALTSDETKEMVLPVLEALTYLHRQNLVAGRLTPPNILVVGNQVKLASDHIQPANSPANSPASSTVASSAQSTPPPSPPESRTGVVSPAGDIWHLGLTLIETLTQARPAGDGDELAAVGTLPIPFNDLVRRCLARSPAGRPSAAELLRQLSARAPLSDAAPDTRISSAAPAQPPPQVASSTMAPATDEAAASVLGAIPAAGGAATPGVVPASVPAAGALAAPGMVADPSPATAAAIAGSRASVPVGRAREATTNSTGSAAANWTPAKPTPTRTIPTGKIAATAPQYPPVDLPADSPGARNRLVTRIALIVATTLVVLLALRLIPSHKSVTPPQDATASQTSPPPSTANSTTPSTATALPSTGASTGTGTAAPPAPQASPPPGASTAAAESSGASSSAVVHEEMPSISRSARETIQGKIKISVRVTVDSTGKVVDHAFEYAGPSRYFERKVGEAASKWRFGPAPGQNTRYWVLHFELTREGATGQAVPRSPPTAQR